MTLRKKLTGILLLSLSLITACGKSKSAYSVAVKGEDDYANVVGVLISTDNTLLASKQIDANEFRIIMQAAGELNLYGSTFADTVEKLHENPTSSPYDYLNAANVVVSEVQNLNINQALHLKNPQAQAALNVALQGISLFLSQASASIAQALPTSTLPPVSPLTINPTPVTAAPTATPDATKVTPSTPATGGTK